MQMDRILARFERTFTNWPKNIYTLNVFKNVTLRKIENIIGFRNPILPGNIFMKSKNYFIK